MKSIKKLNERRIPIVRIDPSLEKYKDMPLFQSTLEKANESLRTVGLPKIEPVVQRSSVTITGIIAGKNPKIEIDKLPSKLREKVAAFVEKSNATAKSYSAVVKPFRLVTGQKK